MSEDLRKSDRGQGIDVERLALAALGKVAPEEVPAFEQGIAGYVEEAREHLGGRRRRRRAKPGEIDAPEIWGVVGPAVVYVVVALCDGVLDGVKQQLSGATERRTDSAVKGVRRLFGRQERGEDPAVQEAPEPGTVEPGVARRAGIVRLSREVGLDEEQAARLADAIEEFLDGQGETG